MSINYKTGPKAKSRSKGQTKGVRSSVGALELKEPSASYFVRNTEVPKFFGQTLTKGEWPAMAASASNSGDVVVDPFLGSGTTAVAAEQLKRQWKGCDLSAEYCRWAADRIELVEDWPVEKWLRYDQENSERRKSIR